MKKILSLITSAILLMACTTACERNTPANNDPYEPDAPEDSITSTGSRYLVVYCSRTGNTGRMAQTIQTTLGCDILAVEPETPYEEDYNAMLDRARAELDAISQGNYPAITTSVESFEDYDIIFIGYPIWFSHMATPMQSFLHSHAGLLAGKRIALFASSGSSGITTSESDASALVPDATFLESLLLTSSTLSEMDTLIPQWLDQLGVTTESESLSISISVNGQTLSATMEDNSASRDLLSRLPMDVTLQDFSNITEKIFYPDPELALDDVSRGLDPVPGDIAIYEPWGNVAIFCKDSPYSDSLIKIGHIDGDITPLNVPGDLSATISAAN